MQAGEVALTPLGLPRVASGNFASVYQMNCGAKSYAVKCFLRNVSDQQERYSKLSEFVKSNKVKHMVGFEYQPNGIYIEEDWFPIVKMDWVEGLGLDQFVRKYWSDRVEISRITGQFQTLIEELKSVGIAHCDLQHGNILVKKDGMKLVDYDGMYVPSMQGQTSPELGHSNYQHPERTDRNFGPELDDFSAWIIYYTLHLLRLDSTFWQRFTGGDECLLFRKADFADPDNSRLMKDIAGHVVPDVRAMHKPLMQLLKTPLAKIPEFNFGTHQSVGTGVYSQVNVKPPPEYPERWPGTEDYFWAVLRPRKSFTDEKLSNGVPVPTEGRTSTIIEVDSTTLERLTVAKTVVKGRSHIVFRMVGADRDRQYAVKLFLYNLSDRHQRYAAIHRHKKKASGRYFVPFVYQKKGIKVGEHYFPVLKMLWVEGETIDEYVRKNLQVNNIGAIKALMPKFAEMVAALANDGIAHGDLEPSNILVDTDDNLKIVDYDAMYVPELASLQECERGLKHFQHPARNLKNYGNYLDNFSALAIYGILVAMTRNPPNKFWDWHLLLKHVHNMAPQLKRESKFMNQKRPDTGGVAMPKAIRTVGTHGLDGFMPVFEKASHTDIEPSRNFDSSLERLGKVIREQKKRRIDQVSKLDLTLWNLA